MTRHDRHAETIAWVHAKHDARATVDAIEGERSDPSFTMDRRAPDTRRHTYDSPVVLTNIRPHNASVENSQPLTADERAVAKRIIAQPMLKSHRQPHHIPDVPTGASVQYPTAYDGTWQSDGRKTVSRKPKQWRIVMAEEYSRNTGMHVVVTAIDHDRQRVQVRHIGGTNPNARQWMNQSDFRKSHVPTYPARCM